MCSCSNSSRAAIITTRGLSFHAENRPDKAFFGGFFQSILRVLSGLAWSDPVSAVRFNLDARHLFCGVFDTRGCAGLAVLGW